MSAGEASLAAQLSAVGEGASVPSSPHRVLRCALPQRSPSARPQEGPLASAARLARLREVVERLHPRPAGAVVVAVRAPAAGVRGRAARAGEPGRWIPPARLLVAA